MAPAPLPLLCRCSERSEALPSTTWQPSGGPLDSPSAGGVAVWEKAAAAQAPAIIQKHRNWRIPPAIGAQNREEQDNFVRGLGKLRPQIIASTPRSANM